MYRLNDEHFYRLRNTLRMEQCQLPNMKESKFFLKRKENSVSTVTVTHRQSKRSSCRHTHTHTYTCAHSHMYMMSFSNAYMHKSTLIRSMHFFRLPICSIQNTSMSNIVVFHDRNGNIIEINR